jgi:hypothetical protein
VPDSPPQPTPEPNPAPTYAGPERRADHPTVVVQTTGHQRQEPRWYDQLPTTWKAFLQLGFAGLVAAMFLGLGLFFLDQFARTNDERRARDAEDREIRRAEIAQQDRRSDQIVAELRMIRSGFESSVAEIRASRGTLERASREMKDLIDKLLKAWNKPVSRLLLGPPPGGKVPEAAPMPRVDD